MPQRSGNGPSRRGSPRRRRLGTALAGLALIVLTGCGAGAPSLPRKCGQLLGSSLESVLPGARTAVDSFDYKTLTCEWRGAPGNAEAPKLAVRLKQPTSYEPGQWRADESLANDWEKDDEQYVTVAVPGVGISAYRFTRILQDQVHVTVRAYQGYRELTVELDEPYPDDGDVTRLEERAVAAARAAMAAA